MKRFASYTGSLGAGFLLAGALLGAMQRARDVYWASFLIIGLVLIGIYVAARWENVSRAVGTRTAKEGANAVVLTVIVLGIVGILNFLADRHAKRWDASSTKVNSLSDQTTRILAELDTDVELVLLDRIGTSQQASAENLLQLYADASERVTLTAIDPDSEPERALPYASPTEPMPLGTILVATGTRHQRATAATESEITNTLIRALATDIKKIYFTTGHDEKSLSDTSSTGISFVGGKLGESAYETEELAISRTSDGDVLRVPDDATALVIAGPRSDFLQDELDALDSYIDRGGHAIVLVDPETQGLAPELVGTIVERGIVLGADVVVDPLARPPLYPVVQQYSRHAVVESLGNAMSIFPLVRSVTMAELIPDGADIRELFTTADDSTWAETRFEELQERTQPTAEQMRGPIGLAMAATLTREDDTPTSRLVVVGDSDFIANEVAGTPQFRNADLFLNMVNWVAQDEGLIAIRPRETEERAVVMNEQQLQNVFFLSVLILPGIVVVTGLSLWWGRR